MNAPTPTESFLLPKEPASDGRTFLNASVWLVDKDGYRVVFHRHEPTYRIALNDEVHRRLVAVMLRQSRVATQEEICRAFGHSVSTQARWERQYAKHGIDGLASKKPPGRGRELDKSQEGFIRRWFQADYSNREIAKRLGVDESTIRRTLKRLGLTRKPAVLPSLPGIDDEVADAATASTAASESGHDVPVPTALPVEGGSPPLQESSDQEASALGETPANVSFTVDHDPLDRSGDRSLAAASGSSSRRRPAPYQLQFADGVVVKAQFAELTLREPARNRDQATHEIGSGLAGRCAGVEA